MQSTDASGSGDAGAGSARPRRGLATISPNLLTDLLECIGASACLWDADLRLVAWNTAYREIFNLPAPILRQGARLAEVLDNGPPMLDDFRPGQELENLTRRSLATKQHMQIDRVLADGRTLSINYNTFGHDGWIAIYRDVTQRRKDLQDVRNSERELKLQNARLDASIESMPYGFSIWDDDYRLVLSNDRYADMYGMP